MSHRETFLTRIKDALFDVYYARVKRIVAPVPQGLSDDLKAVYERAFKDGYRQGYHTGLVDGFQQGVAAVEEKEKSKLDIDLSSFPSTSIGLA